MQDFRRVLVWQRAHTLAVEIRRCTQAFPRSGFAELKSQLTRAADSMATNIVEGCGAATRKEFARYLDISIKSASEVEYQLQLARDNRVLPRRTWWALSREVIEIRKMLFGFRRTVLAAADRGEKRPKRESDRDRDGQTTEN